MGSFTDALFGGEKEYHDDGSSTERFSDGTSITRDSDGSVREWSRDEGDLPFGLGPRTSRVTRDGDDRIINTQPLKD